MTRLTIYSEGRASGFQATVPEDGMWEHKTGTVIIRAAGGTPIALFHKVYAVYTDQAKTA